MIEAQAGQHAWHGSCDPYNGLNGYRYNTFSVGCFQYMQQPSGKLKRGLIKVRVSGFTSYPELVYDRAREICLQLDAGTYTGPKRVTVRPTPIGEAP